MQKEDIKKLADLARIDLTAEEIDRLTKEFDEILSYVDTIKKVSETVSDIPKPDQRNMLRTDSEPHEGLVHTEAILNEAPQVEEGYVKVKKIL